MIKKIISILFFLFIICNGLFSQNILVNSTWQSENGDILKFGQTSYSILFRSNNFSGSYKINGDTIIFDNATWWIRIQYGIFGEGNEEKGSLIGSTITAFGNSFKKTTINSSTSNYDDNKVTENRSEILRIYNSGNYSEVFNLCKSALDSKPNDYFLLTISGFSAYQLGISQIDNINADKYLDDCINNLEKALLLENSRNDGRLFYVLGKAYYYKGRNFAHLSIKNLEAANKLSYNAIDIYQYLGLAYGMIGDYRNSISAFSKALEFSGQGESSDILLLSIARSYIALNEFEMARTYLQRCIDVSSDARTTQSARQLLSDVNLRLRDN